MAPEQKCGNPKCEKQSYSAPLQRCSRCRKEYYCSRDCQTAAWPTHKKNCKRANYILKFHLAPEHIVDPPVTRTVSCMADANFYHLHMALQIVFGWSATHSFDFVVKDPDYEASSDESLLEAPRRRTTTDQQDPNPPREFLCRLVDPADPSPVSGIDRMHEGQRKHPRTLGKKAEKTELWQVFDHPEYQDKEIVYTYDFGDKWEHYISVEGRAEPTTDFQVLDGTGHGVAEDVGGVDGWEALKAAYRTTAPSTQKRERQRWFEEEASNSDPLGLAGDRANAWDKDGINRQLAGNKFLDRFEDIADVRAAQLQAILSVARASS